MAASEKKYIVGSFEEIRKKLGSVHAAKGPEITAVHYYGVQDGNDVTKLVVYSDRSEIHELKESGGTYTFLPSVPVSDKREGFAWLKNKGFTSVQIVKMAYTEYGYQGGTVGLYVIDDFLHCVILYYPKEEHEARENEFGLETSEILSVPFNKYLDRIGRLRSESL